MNTFAPSATSATPNPARAIRVAAAIMVAAVLIETPLYGTEPLGEAMQHPVWVPITAAVFVAHGLAASAVTSLARAQGRALSAAGRRAATAAAFGFLVGSGMLFVHTFISPVLAAEHPVAFDAILQADPPPAALLLGFIVGRVSLYVGLIVLGAAALRARTVPMTAALVVILGSGIGLLTSPLSKSITVGGIISALPFLGLAMMGSMRTEPEADVARPDAALQPAP